MSRFAASFAFVVCLAAAVPASAEQISVPVAFTHAIVSSEPASQPPLWTTRVVTEQKRPASLIPMYASFALLQGLDYHSTTSALSSGVGREGNPVMGAVVSHKPAFLALKAASTAGVVLVGEKLWKRNRVGAIVFMAVANGVMASVVAHNYSVMR